MADNTKTIQVINDPKSKKGNGVSFATILTVVFINLKLSGEISWSWIWVLSPIWIEFVIVLLCFAFIGIIRAIKK